jgi:MFS family permease
MNVRIVYLIELINCFAAVYYSNFIFFYMKSRFGFGAFENLLLAALNGLIYMIASRKGGQFAQRFGYLRSIYVGSLGFAGAMFAGIFLDSIPAHIIIFALWTVSVCFIYPAISALVCDGAGVKISDRVGYYNMTWAAGGAVAYFTTGMLLERLGMRSLFWMPLLLTLLMLLVLIIFARTSSSTCSSEAGAPAVASEMRTENGQHFLHLAWFANPLCYVAINTLIPLMPSLSGRLGLTTATAGIVCSVWMFARLGAFILLWRWTGWHYRFWWMAGAFAAIVGCFSILFITVSRPLFFIAQVVFGLSIGLIYYSSLYYSMNASEEKGKHGGLHEAMIGAGLLFGPAFGAGVIALFPTVSNAGTWSISGLLVTGLSIFLWRGRLFWKQQT